MLAISRQTCYNVRMMKRALSLLALAALLAPAFAAEWMEDFDAAKSKAQAENKLILVDFTGSDWCGWCIKLRKEVLDKPEFEAYAQDKFVLMEVDCPHKKKLSDKLMQQNKSLCEQYHISGYPTLLVLNPAGEVVGGFCGYRKQDGIQATLDKAIKTDADLRAAKQLPVEQQAAALSGIYQQMSSDARKCGGYIDDGQEAAAEQREAIKAKLCACSSVADMKKVIEEAEPTILPGNKTFFLDRKFTIMVNAAETTEDILAARKVADELIAALPAPYAAHVQKQIDADFADPAAFLKRLNAARAAEASSASEAK